MFSPFESAGAWWASSRRNARGAAVGAVLIGGALVAVSAVVWISPSTSPVTQVAQLAETVTRTEQLLDQRNQLLSEIAELRWKLDEKYSESGALEAELAAVKEVLVETQDALAAATTESASPPGNSANGTGSGSGGSGNGGSAARPSTPDAPSRSELLAPSSPYFGLYTEQAPFNWATLDSAAEAAGAAPTMVGYFGGWDEDFRADAVTRSWQRDMFPMLTWESRPIDAGNDVIDEPEYSLPRIIDGEFDDYVEEYARDIADTGLPLAIRLNHEMNGIWYPWAEDDGRGNPINGNGAGDFVEMWRHVHDIFEQEGANDYVIWVWSPNRIDKLPAAHQSPEYLASLYPGDEYVDWVGMSGYLRPPFLVDEEISFDATFGATLDQLRDLTDKPIVLAEVGASETGGHKPEWLRSFFDGLEAEENRDIIGFAWFNLAVTTYVEGVRSTNDWRITSRADSLAAFTEGLLGDGSRFK